MFWISLGKMCRCSYNITLVSFATWALGANVTVTLAAAGLNWVELLLNGIEKNPLNAEFLFKIMMCFVSQSFPHNEQ